MNKTTTIPLTIVAIIAALLPLATVVPAAALVPHLSSLRITEVRAGTPASASEEFIEITNVNPDPVDMGDGYCLQLASSTATSWQQPLRSLRLSGVLGANVGIGVLASQSTSNGQTTRYLPTIARQWFSAGISASGGHLRIVRVSSTAAADPSCAQSPEVIDQLEWSIPKDGGLLAPSLDGDTVLTLPSSGISPTASLQRITQIGQPSYIDTNNSVFDFRMATPSPGAVNAVDPTTPPVQPPASNDPPPEPPTPEPEEDPPVPPVPDPPIDTHDDSDDPAGDDTPVPVPNEGLDLPYLTEVLPNPASPQTDAADEFIELYNPNASPFDLSGFVLEAGLSTKHRYTFPTGTVLSPAAYRAFYSQVTGISLTNSEGRVALYDASGVVVSSTDAYGAAKAGESWILIDGAWRWTSLPTPSTINTVVTTAGVVAAVKTATTKKVATAPKKVTTAKAVKEVKPKTTKPKASKPKVQPAATAASQDKSINPLHPAVLAVAAIFAVLYGAYEYRGDLANKLHKFRADRATRREARRIAGGR